MLNKQDINTEGSKQFIRHLVIFWIQNIGQIKIKDGTNFKSFREEKFPLDTQ